MLWVNLIMDSLGSLALATEPPYDELLDRPPTRKNESIINGKMWKHIIIQAACQLALLIVLYLLAPKFIKENNLRRQAENLILLDCYGELPGGRTDPDYIIYGISTKWKSDQKLQLGRGPMQCGKYSERQDMSVAFKAYCNSFGSTTHIAVLFNVFVIYTLFNEINARVLDDSFNIFQRIHRNIFFPLITLSELALQAIIIQFSNMAFKVVEQGLTGKQWGITIGFSAITFVVSIIAKLIPLDVCIQNMLDNSEKNNKVANEDDLQRSNSRDKLNKSSDTFINVDGQNNPATNNQFNNQVNTNQGNENRGSIIQRAFNSIGSRRKNESGGSIKRIESYLRRGKIEVPIFKN